MADIEFKIERDGFDPINLDTDGSGKFGLRSNTAGFGIPPLSPQFIESAGDGGTYQGDRVGMRVLDVGITILGRNRLETSENIRNLSNLVRARHNRPLPKLVAYYATGEIFELPFVYTSGLEIDHTNALETFYQTVISLTCPDPFWTERVWQSIMVKIADSGRSLIPDLAELSITSSQAIGRNIIFVNSGDYECDTLWVISGPASTISVDIDGAGFLINSPVTAEEVITVDGKFRTIKDQNGLNRYSDFGPAPRFPRLQPGENIVTIEASDATSTSTIQGFYRPRREVIY